MLAQAERPSSRGSGVPVDLLIWIGVLIVVVVVGGLVLVHVQKRMLKPPSAGPGAAGIMEELRRMRDSGAMTDEEYEATRKTMARKLAPSATPASAKGSNPARRSKGELLGGAGDAGGHHRDADGPDSNGGGGGGDSGGGGGGGDGGGGD